MNNFNNNAFKIIALGVILAFLTAGFVFWQNYLYDHFMGTFDAYGLPSQSFRTGWPLMIDAWPFWFFPSLLMIILVQVSLWVIQQTSKSKQQKEQEENSKKTTAINAVKEKSNIEFNRALEIEGLKQQVEILKHKYFEEHHKLQEIMRNTEESTLSLQLAQKEAAEAKAAAERALSKAKTSASPSSSPSNAHNEAVITSLKAENKKLQKQVAELQEDLEQSNALIEKLLETQGN